MDALCRYVPAPRLLVAAVKAIQVEQISLRLMRCSIACVEHFRLGATLALLADDRGWRRPGGAVWRVSVRSS